MMRFFNNTQGPIIEKDSNIQKLGQDVLKRMQDIVEQERPVPEELTDIKFVSFEDALKELSALPKP